tara:strand:+ start:178 stop:363 length:186 start_codon:yes stop_codon:yes gene_type:complete
METLKDLLNRINELQEIIDRETTDADAGCDRSKSLVINAENEKDQIQDMIDQLAINSQLIY